MLLSPCWVRSADHTIPASWHFESIKSVSLRLARDVEPYSRRHALAANLSWQLTAFAVVFPFTMARPYPMESCLALQAWKHPVNEKERDPPHTTAPQYISEALERKKSAHTRGGRGKTMTRHSSPKL